MEYKVLKEQDKEVVRGNIIWKDYDVSQSYECACSCSCICDCACFCSCFDNMKEESLKDLTEKLILTK